MGASEARLLSAAVVHVLLAHVRDTDVSTVVFCVFHFVICTSLHHVSTALSLLKCVTLIVFSPKRRHSVSSNKSKNTSDNKHSAKITIISCGVTNHNVKPQRL